MINVRCPHVKWHHGNFEPNAGEQEKHSDEEELRHISRVYEIPTSPEELEELEVEKYLSEYGLEDEDEDELKFKQEEEKFKQEMYEED